MAHADFVHLRVHTAYSLAEGAIHIKDLANQCQGLGLPAVAMTDTNNLFGALEFSEVLAGVGVQPLVGVTLSVRNPYLEDDRNGRPPTPDQLVLLAQSAVGYGNLMALVSRAHLDSDAADTPHVELARLNGRTDGVIALTGGPAGPVGRLLLDGRHDKAGELLDDLAGLFDDRLYVELLRHGLDEEGAIEEDLLDLAYDRDLPIVATNEAFFVSRDMYEAHDALICIAEGAYVAARDRRRLTAEHRLKTAPEMRALFDDLPEAVDNTLVIAQRCAFKVAKVEPILPNFAAGQKLSEADLLRQQAQEGLNARLTAHVFAADDDEETRGQKAEPYRQRLAHELDIIIEMGFPGYFLIVADFIQWAKDHGIPVGPGRGSGAGSVVAWALRITDLDPLRFSLLFERFLNPERVSMPDFDIDFCQDKREQVIRYVQDKYGHDQVAQIITFGKLQARAVLRDVGRVLQQPYPVTDRLCKLVPNNPANPVTLAEAIAGEARLQHERDTDELTAQVIDRSLKLEGLYRHASTHAAGVVIGDRPLDQLVPLYRDPRHDMPVTQFNMKWVEQAGLVKFDFLGLKTLTVLDTAVEHIRGRGVAIDLDTVPFDDAATFQMLSEGDSAGVFQLESSGMRSVLKGLKPDKFEDIIAIVALYRPGPMDNIPTYVNRKHGEEPVDYPHEMLADILEETYGVIIYQEQVMQIAQVMAGYSLGEADLLRRAMGKKIQAEMDKQRSRFVTGAVERDVDEAKASWIFDLVAKFAGYGFNKSHAAAYALIAYQTAYLKANYPVEFMAATMTLDMGNTDKLGQFRQELKRLDIPLLPPDVTRSQAAFAVEPAAEPYGPPDDVRAGLAIRYALAAIKGVGEKAVDALVAERTSGGAFRDLFDVAERIDPKLMNKRQLEQLAAAGAFDTLLPDRAQAHGAAETLMRHAQTQAAERASSQTNLFGDAAGPGDRPALPQVAPWTDADKLKHELDAVGFYLSAHPLDSYGDMLAKRKVLASTEVVGSHAHVGRCVRMAGAIDGYRERRSQRTGKKFAHLALSDSAGGFEVMVFEDLIERARDVVETNAPVVLSVDVKKRDDDDSIRLSARGIEALDDVAAQSAGGLEVFVRDTEPLEHLHTILGQYRGGRGRVCVVVTLEAGQREATVELPGPHKVSPLLRGALAAVPGVVDVRDAFEAA